MKGGAMENDNVNHPNHYTFGRYEVIDVLEDLKKAAWYLNRRIGRETPDF